MLDLGVFHYQGVVRGDEERTQTWGARRAIEVGSWSLFEHQACHEPGMQVEAL